MNGTQGMLAIGILALARAERLLARTADVVAAMTIEASLGTDAPFDERLHALRPHPGQAAAAANLRRLLQRLADPRVAPRLAAPRPGRVFAPVHARRCTARRATRSSTSHPFSRSRPTPSRTTPSCWWARRRGGRGPHRRELPRDARRGRDGCVGAVARVGGLDQRSTALPAPRCQAVQRPAAVPRARERAEQRLHADPVHGAPRWCPNRSRWHTRHRSTRSRPARDRRITSAWA